MQSLERAFAILDIIAGHPNGISFTEIAGAVDLPPGTVGRFLNSLHDLNAVEKTSNPDGYRIGARLFQLTGQLPFKQQLSTIAYPYLLELAEATRETVNLGMVSGDEAIYLEQIDADYQIQLEDFTHRRYPLHVTSTGKVFMAHWPEERLAAYLSIPLKKYTPQTIVDPDALRAQLRRIRAQGYAEVIEEAEEGLIACAAPVYDDRGHVIASVAITGPGFRFPAGAERVAMIGMLLDVCERISDRLYPVAKAL